MRDDRDVTLIESDSGAGFKWFVLGAAIGAGLGILFAPQAGDRTRRELARRGRRLRAEAGDKLDDLSGELQARGRKIKESVAEFADDVADEVKDGKRKLERSAHTAREELERRLADARTRARAAVGGDGVAEDDDAE
ncbi:MAG: YtxH domain-containing protein [Gemmatimonadales bacterium]